MTISLRSMRKPHQYLDEGRMRAELCWTVANAHSIPVWVRRRQRPIQFERKCDACDNKTNSSIFRGDYGVRADRCRVQSRDQIRRND
jgi:hypothetical protein